MEKYNFDHVIAFAITAFNNWKHSANKDNTDLSNFKIFVEPLKNVFEKYDVIEHSKILFEIEKLEKNKNI